MFSMLIVNPFSHKAEVIYKTDFQYTIYSMFTKKANILLEVYVELELDPGSAS